MPYSFFEIERQKSWIIGALFIFLIFLYCLSSIVLWTAARVSFYLYSKLQALQELNNVEVVFHPLTSTEALVILIISLVLGIIHWINSQYRLIDRFLVLLKAESLDLKDKYHQVLNNIVEEASIACGGIKFESYVISTSALNAFSLADLGGRKVIGITEGLIGKLSRFQLQAVIGHEIAHILSGDCLSSTITSSIFEFYSSVLESQKRAMYEEEKPGGLVFFGPIIVFTLLILHNLTYLFNILISRQREYRADAVAARLTRDPLSLAQALYIISRAWRGEGFSGDRLSSIFIVNPRYTYLDEKEGLFFDMFSTHPPIKKRIDILLSMAGVDEKTLEEMTKELKRQPSTKVQIESGIISDKKWFVADLQNQWFGPFDLSEVLKLDWLKPYSWVRLAGDEKAKMAYEYSELKILFKPDITAFVSEYSCPNCYQGMEKLEYEGRTLWRCAFCKGILIKRADLRLVIIRKEEIFSDEVIRKAELIIQDSNLDIKRKVINTENLIDCPQCHKRMKRMFFSWESDVDFTEEEKVVSVIEPLHLAIDKCIWCDLFRLDRTKIGILQYIYEKYQ